MASLKWLLIVALAGYCGLEISPRFTLQVISDAPRHVRRIAGDAKQRPLRADLDPDDSARARPVADPIGR